MGASVLFKPSSFIRKVFSFYPLVPLLLCFICGILAGMHISLPFGWQWLLCLFCFFSVVALAFLGRPLFGTLLVLTLSLLAGWLAVGVAMWRLQTPPLPLRCMCEAVVADEPVTVGRSSMRADLIIVSGPLSGKGVRAYFADATTTSDRLSVGGGIVLDAQFREPRSRQGMAFDYISYLKGHGIVATASVRPAHWYVASISLSSISLLTRARLSALCLRHRIGERYSHLGLSGQNLAVASAMVLGNKAEVSAAVRDAYSVAGTSHILALSGMHLGIIYGLLSLFSRGRRRWFLHELLIVVAIWCYVFMVGMSSSVVRAAVMLTVYSIVGLANRRGASLNVLAFTAWLMLVVNPFTLFDLGFQLSFSAMAFILAFHSSLSPIVPLPFQQRHPLVRFFWQLVLMSMIATIGTMPLVATYFGRFPVYFLVANLIVVPAATFIIYMFLALPLFSLVPLVGSWVAFLLDKFVAGVNVMLASIASWPCASVSLPPLSLLQVVLLYVVAVAVLTAASLFLRRRNFYRLFMT